ncbi:MAG: hypothetical protein ACRCYX_11955 [Dermatophilaceae bacterium]
MGRAYPFVVIEGLDGTGKTTARKGLFRLFENLYDITPLCVLTTNFLAPAVAADIVEGKYTPSMSNRDSYLAAVLADKHATLHELIRPSLGDRPVIADRWLISELAFFAVKHGIRPDETYQHIARALDDGPGNAADVTFVLTLDPRESVARARGRAGDATRADWDTTDVQTRVQLTYNEVLTHPEGYPLLGEVVPVDAGAPAATVLATMWRTLIDHSLVPDLPRTSPTTSGPTS